LHVIEAPTEGTGKGLLANVIGLVATGDEIAACALPGYDDEIRKMVTAELSRAKSVILLDNINTAGGRRLDSPALASVLTATTWTDRILKETQMTDLPNEALWFLTANNPQMSRELARRSVRIRLVPAEEQPWLRTAFKYPDLKGWARANRGRLIWAALVLARAWQAGGRRPR
jgi:hypothetical protein